jgi:glycosyltransferase involved in cell wall biosynthesis
MGAVSVVIPAHDEAAVIERCLAALNDGGAGRPLEVIVACNGCTDDTPARARRAMPSATVLELPDASKIAALDAGDAAASAFPRFYVDADVELTGADLALVADALDRGPALCAAPRPSFEIDGRPWAVRAFYGVWSRLPYLTEVPVGNGVYAVSAEGRRRFERFPGVVADDLFVQGRFTDAERVVVPTATFTVHPPRTLRGLYHVRVRAHRGKLELQRAGAAPPSTQQRSVRAALGLAADPRRMPAVAVYLGVNLAARIAAGRRLRAGVGTWERDDSGRAPATPVDEGRSVGTRRGPRR